MTTSLRPMRDAPRTGEWIVAVLNDVETGNRERTIRWWRHHTGDRRWENKLGYPYYEEDFIGWRAIEPERPESAPVKLRESYQARGKILLDPHTYAAMVPYKALPNHGWKCIVVRDDGGVRRVRDDGGARLLVGYHVELSKWEVETMPEVTLPPIPREERVTAARRIRQERLRHAARLLEIALREARDAR